jgi:hypothetical protein
MLLRLVLFAAGLVAERLGLIGVFKTDFLSWGRG